VQEVLPYLHAMRSIAEALRVLVYRVAVAVHLFRLRAKGWPGVLAIAYLLWATILCDPAAAVGGVGAGVGD
jgi:hypothetical protein